MRSSVLCNDAAVVGVELGGPYVRLSSDLQGTAVTLTNTHQQEDVFEDCDFEQMHFLSGDKSQDL
jgi:hypothetical protein